MSASAAVSRLDPSDRLLLAALAISVGVHAALLA
jgi:hypothetical protein